MIKTTLLVLTCFLAVAFASATVDDFTIDSDVLKVTGGTDPAGTTLYNAVQSNSIIGGERDVVIIQAPNAQNQCVSRAGSIDTGFFQLSQGSSCSADAQVQWDGTTDVGDKSVLAHGLNVNLNNLGYAFKVTAGADLSTTFSVEVYTDSNNFSRFTQSVIGSGSNSITTDFVIPFSGFTRVQGVSGADFSNVGSIVITTPAAPNVDFSVDIVTILSVSITGRYWVDCNCDGTKQSVENGLGGQVVTATPTGGGNGCTQTFTATTNSDGTYSMNVAQCIYTVSVVAGSTFCSNGGPSQTNINAANGATVNFRVTAVPTLVAPNDVQITCRQSLDPDRNNNLGKATLVSSCGGNTGGTPTYSDVTVEGDCVTTVIRTWAFQGQTDVQTITVVDTGVAPTLSIPNDKTVKCGGSTDPKDTGRATANDDCSQAVVTFVDDSTANCNANTCKATTVISRVWTATDGCQSTSKTQTITVKSCQDGQEPCPTPTPFDINSLPFCDVVEDEDGEDDFGRGYTENSDAGNNDQCANCDCGHDRVIYRRPRESDASTLTVSMSVLVCLALFALLF